MKHLNEKKDHLIKKMPYLTAEDKAIIIEFFNKHPEYEKEIDWQRKDYKRSDFDKIIAKQGLKLSRKQQKVINPDIPHIYSNEMWDFYMPLTWQGGIIADSPKLGGQKAGWCIGWEKSPEYFDGYRANGDSFIIAVRKELPEGFTIEGFSGNSAAELAIRPYEDKFEAIKYAIQITDEYDSGYGCAPKVIGRGRGIRAWCQSDHDTLYNEEAFNLFKSKIFLNEPDPDSLMLKWDKEYNDIVDAAKNIWNMLILPPITFLDDDELDFADDDYLEMLIDQYDRFTKLPEVINNAARIIRRSIVKFSSNPLILGIIFETSAAKMEAVDFVNKIYSFLGFSQEDVDKLLKKYGLQSLAHLKGRDWITNDRQMLPDKYKEELRSGNRYSTEIFTTLFEKERERLDSLFED